jgi:hypothetical protein
MNGSQSDLDIVILTNPLITIPRTLAAELPL